MKDVKTMCELESSSQSVPNLALYTKVIGAKHFGSGFREDVTELKDLTKLYLTKLCIYFT